MDFEAKLVIEALRSGIPSRAIGGYFSSARSELLAGLSDRLGENRVGGEIITASYGEGKTHLLNTVFKIAQNKNMAVSMVSLSRETPFNNPHLIYKKIAQNTYLPDREQPGFEQLIEKLSAADMTELQLYAAKSLQTDKLYYLLEAYTNTDNSDVKFSLMADLQGDFITNEQLKKIYREIFAKKIVFSQNFAKSRHYWDYHMFLSKLFSLSGLGGWVLLFDEAEHIGRLGPKARLNAYYNMSKYLQTDDSNPAFALFTMTSNYKEEVIGAKKERERLETTEGLDRAAIESVLDKIESAAELSKVDRDEFMTIVSKIVDFHSRAYEWTPSISATDLCEKVWSLGQHTYLRTKIRAAIEHLDQLFQYGDTGTILAEDLEQETYSEEIPLPEEL